jgi:hypothetical protein
MKRKIHITTITIFIFILISIINLSIAKNNSEKDTSLDLISVMSKAFDEGESGSIKRYCYDDWTQDPYEGSGPQEWFRMCSRMPGPLACPINLGWIIDDTKKKECEYQVE